MAGMASLDLGWMISAKSWWSRSYHDALNHKAITSVRSVLIL